jgi:hypothetical protein
MTLGSDLRSNQVCGDRVDVLGGSHFRHDGGRRARHDQAELGALHGFVVAMVCAAYGISRAELMSPSRNRAPVARARQVAMYLEHVVAGLSMTTVGLLFGRDRTTASHACRLIEDERDNPKVDLVLEILAATLIGWWRQDCRSQDAA